MNKTGWIVLIVGIVVVAIVAWVLANRQKTATPLGDQTSQGRSMLQNIFSLAGADKEAQQTAGTVGDIFGGFTART